MHIILVHGAFHTGQCWSRLAPILRERGHFVSAPTLRGHAGRARNPLRVSWHSYAEDIIAVAQSNDEPALLIGHSLAGFAIAAAAERRPGLFAALVYLTAAVPKNGRSTLADTTPAGERPATKLQPNLTVRVPPEQATKFFYHRCSPAVQAEAARWLSPQPLRPLLSAIRTSEARSGMVPRHFIECSDDRLVSLDGQRANQRNLSFRTVQTLDSDHSPFLSCPNLLADAIGRIIIHENDYTAVRTIQPSG